jgi:hypothetical protein
MVLSMDIKTKAPAPSFAKRLAAAGVVLRGSQHQALAFVHGTSVAEIERLGGARRPKTF